MTHERVITNFQILEKWKDEGHKIALWIGRAKLPHIGHISYLKALWEKGYKLVIANGSCYTINSDNPIQVFEVQAMLALSLRLEGVPADDFTFVPVPDFHDNDKWRAFVTGMPNFCLINALATDNPRGTEALGDAVKGMELLERDIITDEIDINATRLRAAVRDNNIGVWEKYAATGTKAFLAASGDFYRIANAVLGKDTDFEQGRQCVDLFMFVHDGFRWQVVLGNRRDKPGKDFVGYLASPGGGIEDYESPIQAALHEASEETGIPMRISEPHILPSQIVIANNQLAHLHYVGKFSSPDPKLSGKDGGTSMVFMTIYDGSIDSLERYISSGSDLENVRLVSVEEALSTTLAFQQSTMLKRAYKLLEKIRG